MSGLSDPIADFLTRMKNAVLAEKRTFTVPTSRIKESIAKVLEEEGYIDRFEVLENKQGFKILKLMLRISSNNRYSVSDVKRVSKPGLRVYVPVDKIPSVLNGFGISILSTSQGVMTGSKARKENLGGEILAFIW